MTIDKKKFKYWENWKSPDHSSSPFQGLLAKGNSWNGGSSTFLTSQVKHFGSTINNSHWHRTGSGLVSTQTLVRQRRRQRRRPALPKDPNKQTTDEFYTTCNLPARWQRPYWFSGYGSQQNPPPHPFYRSSYMDIGWFPPNVHTVPVSFYPSQQRFSNLLATCGMYRNSSLNTALDPQPWGM